MRTCPQCRRRFAQGEAFCPYDGARLRDEPRDPTRPPDDEDPLVGAQLDGRYRLQAVLGKGGMGTVYAGRQMAIHKMVAIKTLREVDEGGQAMGRFEREARSASRLGHPNIVDIFDFGRTAHPLGGPDALAYLVMELLDGEDLCRVTELVLHECAHDSPLYGCLVRRSSRITRNERTRATTSVGSRFSPAFSRSAGRSRD